jgi:hypothetical protein
MKKIGTLCLSLVALMLVSRNLSAICFRVENRVQSLYSKSTIVCVATVVSEQSDDGDLEHGYVHYELKIENPIKGNPGSKLRARTENDSGRTSLDVGKKYILFMYGKNNDLINWGCGHEAEYEFPLADKKLAETLEMRRKFQGPVSCNVRIQVIDSNAKPVADAAFYVSGHRFKKRLKTGADGFVSTDLPVGFFAVTSQDFSIKTEVFDEGQTLFDLESGESEDLLFIKKDRNPAGTVQ